MFSRKFLSIILVLSAFFYLVGCSSNNSNTQNTDSNNTLVFGRGSDSITLDPAMSSDGESLNVTTNIYDTLVNFAKQDVTVKPGLATSWEVSPDGKVYTLHLRKNVKFHDNTPFNADAVVYNFNRWMNPEKPGDFPSYGAMFGGYGTDKKNVIKEVKALDDSTVQFTLKTPLAPFLNDLAMAKFAIASPAAIKKYGDKFNEHPVGTGPYVFKQWKRNDRIVLEKNKDYFVKGQPKINQVIFRVIPDNTARLNALTSGEIDLMDGLDPSSISQVKANKNLQVFSRPSMNTGYLGFNTEMKPFNSPQVRQALNYAIDREKIIQDFFDGQATSAKNPIPPTIKGYNDVIPDYTYDLQKAKDLLAEAGYPNGFKMDLYTFTAPRPYMPDGRKVAEAIQASFAKIGVQVSVKAYEFATHIEKVKSGDAGAFFMGWTGDNGDADNFLYMLLDTTSVGSNNYARYKNEDLHKILVQARESTDPQERITLYKQAQEIIHQDAPWAPLVHANPTLAGKSNIQGFVPQPAIGSDKLGVVSYKK